MNFSKEEIIEKVRLAVSQVIMDKDVSTIGIDDSLINDLGLDSLDFLDLVFRLEAAFKVRIKRGEIEGRAREATPDENYEKNGILTPEGLSILQAILDEIPAERFKPNMRVVDVPALYTVATFVKLVENTLKFQEYEAEQAALAATSTEAAQNTEVEVKKDKT